MPTRIKNCGLKNPESIDQAVKTGASFVGFVHHAASPRHISIAEMATLVAHTNHRSKTVAVLVNPTDDLLNEIIRTANPDFLQLHETDNAARITAISQLYTKPIITALAVRSASDLTYAAALEEVSNHLLFDAKSPGSGTAFDWTLLKNLQLKKSWFLAGGLTQENVAQAIRTTHAPMVDVSSGIESAPGIKSLEKIAAFNAAVLNAAHD